MTNATPHLTVSVNSKSEQTGVLNDNEFINTLF